jgi:hypothetical protein
LPPEIQARREAAAEQQRLEVKGQRSEVTPEPPHLRGTDMTSTRLTPAQERAMAETDDFTALGETRAEEPTAPRPYAVGMAELEEL